MQMSDPQRQRETNFQVKDLRFYFYNFAIGFLLTCDAAEDYIEGACASTRI